MYEMDLLDNTENVNRLLARYGVKFGIYKNNTFKEQLFPFDAIPRVIQKEEFDYLERGLKQRVMALNLFLDDIYHDKKIVRDQVIPEDFIFASSELKRFWITGLQWNFWLRIHFRIIRS